MHSLGCILVNVDSLSQIDVSMAAGLPSVSVAVLYNPDAGSAWVTGDSGSPPVARVFSGRILERSNLRHINLNGINIMECVEAMAN